VSGPGPANRRRALLAALALAALLARPAAAEEKDGSAPAAEKGRLAELAPVIRRLIPLTVEKGALRLDREAWNRPPEGKAAEDLKAEFEAALVKQGLPKEWAARQAAEMSEAPDAERIFNLLQLASKSHGSSRSSGNNERSMQFSGGGLAAKLSIRGNAVQIELSEEKGPRRSVDVEDDGEGAFRMVAAGGDGAFLAVVHQARGGRFSVAFVEGEQPFAAAAPTFPAFYREHRGVVEQRILPLLALLGVGAPLTPENPLVREAVLSGLRPVGDGEREEAERRIRALDDADHAKREEATQFLIKNGGRHRAMLEEALKRPAVSPEASARLTRILAENVTRRRAVDLAEALKLAEDPAFLVRLLAEAKEEDRPGVAAALEKATGQKLGTDAEAWTKWLETAKPAGGAPKAAPDPAGPPDPLKGADREARVSAARVNLQSLATSLEMYKLDIGNYPSMEEGLAALIKSPAGLKNPANWGGPYIRSDRVPLDPWGTPYLYIYPGRKDPVAFELFSAGPDRKDGTDDDIAR
jgi:type II secretion system protein G